MASIKEEAKARLDFTDVHPSPAKSSADLVRIQDHLFFLQASMREMLLERIQVTDALKSASSEDEHKHFKTKLSEMKEAIQDLADEIKVHQQGLESASIKVSTPSVTAASTTSTSLYAPHATPVASAYERPQYYKTPAGLPLFDVLRKDFDLFEFFREFRSVMMSAAVPSAHWPRMLLSRFPTSMHMDKEQYIEHFGFDNDKIPSPPWDVVVEWFTELYPQPDKVQQYSREFHTMRKTTSMSATEYNNKYALRYKAKRAKIVFRDEEDGIKFVESLDPVLYNAVRSEIKFAKKIAKSSRVPFDGSVEAMMKLAYECESELLQSRLNREAHQQHVKAQTPAPNPSPSPKPMNNSHSNSAQHHTTDT